MGVLTLNPSATFLKTVLISTRIIQCRLAASNLSFVIDTVFYVCTKHETRKDDTEHFDICILMRKATTVVLIFFLLMMKASTEENEQALSTIYRS